VQLLINYGVLINVLINAMVTSLKKWAQHEFCNRPQTQAWQTAESNFKHSLDSKCIKRLLICSQYYTNCNQDLAMYRECYLRIGHQLEPLYFNLAASGNGLCSYHDLLAVGYCGYRTHRLSQSDWAPDNRKVETQLVQQQSKQRKSGIAIVWILQTTW